MMAIRSTIAKFKMDEVVDALLSEEIGRKSFEVAKEALIAQGRVKDKSKKDMKPECSMKKLKAKCWNCKQGGYIQKDCKEEKKKKKMKSSLNSESSHSDDEDVSNATMANFSSDDD